MKSESKRLLVEIQRKTINPITHKPSFRTPDEVLEEALDHLYRHLKQQKVF
jgi:ribosome maturation protein Sdo1